MVQPLRSINPRPKLVVCDFDGTLLNGPGPVSPAVRQAMQDVVDAGHWITVCTGRGYQLLQPFLGQFVVNAPLICCNGALILEPDSLRPIFAAPTPLDVAHDAVRLAVTRGWRVLAYLADMQTLLYYGYSPFDPPVSYTHLRAHETVLDLVCRLLLEKKNHTDICLLYTFT